jgi:cytochrome c oxidase assembly protein subunit 15
MHTLARISLILVLVLVTLSAYLRLDHSGIGCEPWPACYGNIGIAGEAPGISDTYERLLEEASEPLSWATPLHRLVASVLGLLILSMTLLAMQTKSQRLITLGLLALTVFLAWLGIYSEGLHSPAVVMGNLGASRMTGQIAARSGLGPHSRSSRSACRYFSAA